MEKVLRRMCAELSKFVDRILEMSPDIESAQPRCTIGINALCSALPWRKSELLIQHCTECSKLYLAKLVIFPRRAGKFKNGDSTAEELASATQVQGDFMPITREKPVVELVKVTSEMKDVKAYQKLRLERTNKRHQGKRIKRAAEAEKEEKK